MSRSMLTSRIEAALERIVRKWGDEKAEDVGRADLRRAADEITDEVLSYLRTYQQLEL